MLFSRDIWKGFANHSSSTSNHYTSINHISIREKRLENTFGAIASGLDRRVKFCIVGGHPKGHCLH